MGAHYTPAIAPPHAPGSGDFVSGDRRSGDRAMAEQGRSRDGRRPNWPFDASLALNIARHPPATH